MRQGVERELRTVSFMTLQWAAGTASIISKRAFIADSPPAAGGFNGLRVAEVDGERLAVEVFHPQFTAVGVAGKDEVGPAVVGAGVNEDAGG